MKRLFIIPIIIVILLGAFTVYADEANNPLTNPNANACAEGGVMEGKCNVDFDDNGQVDDYEVNWAWECGWYVIRYDYGVFTREEVPSRCDSLLLPNAPQFIDDGCYIWSADPLSPSSIFYTGPANTRDNLLWFDTLDCTGTPRDNSLAPSYYSIVLADNQPDAITICGTMGGIFSLQPLIDHDPTAPPTYYHCANYR